MSGRVVASEAAENLFSAGLPIDSFQTIIESIEGPFIVADRKGVLLAANGAGRALVRISETPPPGRTNIFENLFGSSGMGILEELATGRTWVDREISIDGARKIARVRLTSHTDWLVVQVKENAMDAAATSGSATQVTVQELLQEREITYRNLLAAYL